MTTNSKTVIFDMDGTLIDSSGAICITINQTRQNLGIKTDLQKELTVNSLNKDSI